MYKYSKLGIGLTLGYILLVLYLWYDVKYGSCGDIFCQVPLAISSWPLGVEADMHNLENILGLSLNSLADPIIIFGQIFNSVFLWVFGNWITHRKSKD